MGPYDKDVAYLRELAERLNTTPDEDPDYLRIRFNDLYTALDRFLRLIASEDPNVPPQVQMEAADKTTTDSARVYEILAAYVPHFMDLDEVRRLKYLAGVRARVLHQNEDVTPQAVGELLDITDLLGVNAARLGVTGSGPAARGLPYTSSLAAAMDTGEVIDNQPPALGYSAPPLPRPSGVRTLSASRLGSVSPGMLIGASVFAVLVVAGLVFFLSRPQATPGSALTATQTPLIAGDNATPVAAGPTATEVPISDVSPISSAPATSTAEPPTPPPPAPRWTTTDILNLREAPSTTATILRELPAGAIVTSHEDNAEQTAEEFTWLHVVDDQGNAGWVAKDFLAPAQP